MTGVIGDPGADLRAAADHMREHHGPAHPRYKFWREVAAWLGTEAAKLDGGAVRSWREFNRAVTAARAYLDSVPEAWHHAGSERGGHPVSECSAERCGREG